MKAAKTAADTPQYLSVAEVAARLGLSARHVYDLIDARELPASHFGNDGRMRKGMRIKIADLEKFERARQIA